LNFLSFVFVFLLLSLTFNIAAAGATGLFAVQLAKLNGNHVIGTVGSDEKVKFLKGLGCDRVINYKKENLHQVLRKEYPEGFVY
jgi:NADPH-dependent curcumin reductase CurA